MQKKFKITAGSVARAKNRKWQKEATCDRLVVGTNAETNETGAVLSRSESDVQSNRDTPVEPKAKEVIEPRRNPERDRRLSKVCKPH